MLPKVKVVNTVITPALPISLHTVLQYCPAHYIKMAGYLLRQGSDQLMH